MFDPRKLILPPFLTCPSCDAPEFGVLSVFDHHFTRRCRACGRPTGSDEPATEPLPPIHKSVLYLDQFAFSNFVHLANPDLDPARTARAEQWRAVYERVTALVAVQALVCPSSGFHTDESLPRIQDETFSRALDGVQIQLSGGLAFDDAIAIEQQQLRAAAELVIQGSISPDDQRLLGGTALRSDPDVWMPRLHVGVTTASLYGGIVEDVRTAREGQANALQQVFASWQQLTPKQVANHFELELASYGPAVLASLDAAIAQAASDPFAGARSAILRYRTLRDVFASTSGDDTHERIVTFLQTDAAAMPKLRLSAAMYAVLARQAATGMKAVEPSFAVDIAIASTVLPYVDAILVDGRCAEVLRQPPTVTEVVRWNTVVLSARDLDAVTVWLDNAASTVTDEQLDIVERVYGQNTADSFRDLFGRPRTTAPRPSHS